MKRTHSRLRSSLSAWQLCITIAFVLFSVAEDLLHPLPNQSQVLYVETGNDSRLYVYSENTASGY